MREPLYTEFIAGVRAALEDADNGLRGAESVSASGSDRVRTLLMIATAQVAAVRALIDEADRAIDVLDASERRDQERLAESRRAAERRSRP